ncbi:HAD family hydrolase [Aspergillus puulaauensis]|uniref:Phosphoglycolate phosphatase n=1 Tax=Aspergillus puulaauensis TaxID=1220207 RepID=A0A7R8AQ64_9EURO|nr:uncharacterized protein APUU_60927S [Aspergillus puulaauensis]BCS27879.1 hypothetical protein APUU_60927S [Aspergillus puulaauensis]
MSVANRVVSSITALGRHLAKLIAVVLPSIRRKRKNAAKSIPPKLIIFDFDGTLMNTMDAIKETWAHALKTLLPNFDPSTTEKELERLISSGAAARVTFDTLWPAEHRDSLNIDYCIRVFRELYIEHGLPLQKAFPCAKEVLLAIASREIPMAIVSNKGVEMIKTSLKQHGLDGIIPDEYIIGDPLYGENRKPHPASYTDILAPRFRAKTGEDLLAAEGDVIMVGDTISDIKFARNIGAKVCWCSFGDGNKEECTGLQPDFTIATLADLTEVINGL